MTDTPTSPDEALVASTAILTLGTGILAFVALGWEPAALILALGWMVVVPLFAILTDAFGSLEAVREGHRPERGVPPADAADDDTDAALDALRRRYARGDIDEVEFERRVERLLETETEERAREVLGDDLDGELDGKPEREREREH